MVNEQLAIPARTVPPNDNGYIMLAAEVDRRGPWARPSCAKCNLFERSKRCCIALTRRPDVCEATQFRAVLIAPGEGTKLLRARARTVRRARYDVVVLIRTSSVAAARALRTDPAYLALASDVRASARYTMELTASNVVRLGDIDHRPNHVFLFNYFYADNNADLLPVFAYTAGWFQAKTGLANSTVLQPLNGEITNNGIINHATWRSFRAFLPSLLVRSSFRSFVLATFAANKIAAQPIL